jgi:hypothetical protein
MAIILLGEAREFNDQIKISNNSFFILIIIKAGLSGLACFLLSICVVLMKLKL